MFTIKKDGQLIVNDYGGYETRNPSTIWCIKEADKIYQWKDFNEIKINTGDVGDNNYSYSNNSYERLVPDFNFHAWPQVGIHDYETFVKEIDDAGLNTFEINKVGWIGNINTNYNRRKLFEIGKQNPKLFHIFNCGNWWKQPNSIVLQNEKYISTPDLVKTYSLLIDIEGCGYSGRLKHLLWSHRPVLLVDRHHKEFFFEHLKEWVHYIPIKRDLSDLVEKTQWCIDHYEEALKIADNAYQFSKIHLTREACYKQWNFIVETSMQSEKPSQSIH
jgi:hypothetical protein